MAKHCKQVCSGIFCGMLLLGAGCNKTDNSDMNYESALNNYFEAHPACLWPQSKKFPVQAATADDAKTEGYDALTDAGLLTRTTAEKKAFIVASKQVNNYDLSDKGRAAWNNDSSQPGYGNFCYGHQDVTSIQAAAPGTNSSGMKTAQVSYKYKMAGVPDWAQSQEMKTAFPQLNAVSTGEQTGQAALAMNGTNWQVNNP